MTLHASSVKASVESTEKPLCYRVNRLLTGKKWHKECKHLISCHLQTHKPGHGACGPVCVQESSPTSKTHSPHSVAGSSVLLPSCGPKQYYPVYPARPSIKCPCRASKRKKVCELHLKSSYFILHVPLVQAAYFPGPPVHNPTLLVLNRGLFEMWEMAILHGPSSLPSCPKCLRNYSTVFIERLKCSDMEFFLLVLFLSFLPKCFFPFSFFSTFFCLSSPCRKQKKY